MRTIRSVLIGALLWQAVAATAQAPASDLRPVATMKQLMLDVIYPASNGILLLVNRGGPDDDAQWTEVRRDAMTLAESANLLIMRNQNAGWITDARSLTEAGTQMYQAAESRDAGALAAAAGKLDASCTTCHKQFRPAVFPPGR